MLTACCHGNCDLQQHLRCLMKPRVPKQNVAPGTDYQPIENYGVIGNMRTAALVGMDGSIDWLCFPHFDSPSVFAAILDCRKGGRFQIIPNCKQLRHKQFYWPDTAILISRFLHADGIA